MKNEFTKTKKQKRQLSIVWLMIFLLIAAFAASIFFSGFMFSRSTRENREKIICKTAKLVVGQINGDKVDQWLENGKDEEYDKTAVILQNICNNSPYVQYIYVYKIMPDSCRVVFDMETFDKELVEFTESDENTSALGDNIGFDEDFEAEIPTLLAGGDIGYHFFSQMRKSRDYEESARRMEQHPVLGARILENIKESPYLSIGARYHHERYDGRGYPDHLKGEKIPEIARIISVADAYDAMTSLRSYRAPIPRIAEEISYINVPAGDIPNVQVDGYRTAASQSIPVEDGMQLSFHTFSLPTARLVWHCPFLNVFGADDGMVFGKNYRDYMLVRLDGECWEGDSGCTVTTNNSRNSDFTGWDNGHRVGS